MINIIEETIHTDYHLERDNLGYLLPDSDVKLRAPSHCSFAFSLNKRDKPTPFRFFSNETQPKHIAKMCDAIVAMNFENELHIFIIEKKTKRTKQYKKQLANGWHFCNWLFSLYKEYKYCYSHPVYIGLLIWEKPRPKSPRKGTTSHRIKNQPESYRSLDLFDSFLEERNTKNIYLTALAQSALSNRKKQVAIKNKKTTLNLLISSKTEQ